MLTASKKCLHYKILFHLFINPWICLPDFCQDPVCKIFQWLTLLLMQRTELPPCSNGVLLATETLLQGIFELPKIFLQSPRLCEDEVYSLPRQTSQQPVTFLQLTLSIELCCFLELEYKCIPFTTLTRKHLELRKWWTFVSVSSGWIGWWGPTDWWTVRPGIPPQGFPLCVLRHPAWCLSPTTLGLLGTRATFIWWFLLVPAFGLALIVHPWWLLIIISPVPGVTLSPPAISSRIPLIPTAHGTLQVCDPWLLLINLGTTNPPPATYGVPPCCIPTCDLDWESSTKLLAVSCATLVLTGWLDWICLTTTHVLQDILAVLHK